MNNETKQAIREAAVGAVLTIDQRLALLALLEEQAAGARVEVSGGWMLTPNEVDVVRCHLRRNQKIEAVRWFRTFSGAPLKEAKEAVDSGFFA